MTPWGWVGESGMWDAVGSTHVGFVGQRPCQVLHSPCLHLPRAGPRRLLMSVLKLSGLGDCQPFPTPPLSLRVDPCPLSPKVELKLKDSLAASGVSRHWTFSSYFSAFWNVKIYNNCSCNYVPHFQIEQWNLSSRSDKTELIIESEIWSHLLFPSTKFSKTTATLALFTWWLPSPFPCT